MTVPILIVDDASEDLVFAQRVLAGNRILNPIHPLSSGSACVDYFLGRSSMTPVFPCIVMLDMVMKPLGGLEVLRKLQKIPMAKGSIIIMMSGLADIKTIAEGYRLGATTFLIKPLVAAELKQMLQAVNGLTVDKTSNGLVLGIQGFASVPQPGPFQRFQPPSL